MALLRIVYFSENRIGVMGRSRRLRELQSEAVSKNAKAKLSGALVHDDLWFIQALEGEETMVVPTRLFADWCMGFASRSKRTEHLFGAHWFNKGMNPASMSEPDILKLMHVLTTEGHMNAGSPSKTIAA